MDEKNIDDFEKYQNYTYTLWQKSILFTCLIVSIVILCFEIFSYTTLLKNSERVVFSFNYILLRIITPSLLNFGAFLTGFIAKRNNKISVKAKNYLSTFSVFMICSVLSIFHNFFHVLLAAPACCFFVSSVFGDTKILRVNAILTIISYTVAAICFWFDPATGSSTYKLLTIAITAALILCAYLFSQTIVKSQAEKLDYIHLNYKRQTVLIEELKIDPLTRLYNRKALRGTLTRTISRSRGEDIKPFLVIIDIDDFKKINDKYGHIRGDEVLTLISYVIKNNMGSFRKAFRFGGEEFVLLFDDSFPSQVIYTVESIRADFEKARFEFAPEKAFTLSAGIAALKKKDDPTFWLDRADKALYSAKAHGKNQIKLSDEF